MARMTFFQAECVDPQTGHTFTLRLAGDDANEARSVPVAWGFVVSTPLPFDPVTAGPVRGRSAVRGGRSVPFSVVANAAQSGDLKVMLAVRDYDCHPVERHFLLQLLSDVAYKFRETRADGLTWSEWACWQWLMEAPILIEAMRHEFQAEGFVRMGVPRRLVLILEKYGYSERALDVARTCQMLNLSQDDLQYLATKAARLDRSLRRP